MVGSVDAAHFPIHFVHRLLFQVSNDNVQTSTSHRKTAICFYENENRISFGILWLQMRATTEKTKKKKTVWLDMNAHHCPLIAFKI